MSLKQAYLIEIERETENTKRILERIEDKHLDYKPHEKSMSMGALAAHIVELHNWVGLTLNKSAFNFHTGYTPLKAESVSDLLKNLEENYEKNVTQIEAMSDEDWFSEWTLQAGDYIIAQVPKVGAMRYIIQNHLIHHRGQLTVYLRMNDIPVPGIFGPSADDKKDF